MKFSEREDTGSITLKKNSPDHLVYPSKFGAYRTIVFDFSWDDCNAQEKLKTMVMPFSSPEPLGPLNRRRLSTRAGDENVVMHNIGGKRGPLWSV